MVDWITDEQPEKEGAYLVTWKCPTFTHSRFIGICDWDADDQRWAVTSMQYAKLYSSIEITAWADVEAYKGDLE